MKLQGFFRARTVIAAAALGVSALALFALLHPRFRGVWSEAFAVKELGEPVLKVTFLYVGQGDATLVRDMRPGGKTMLVDAGPSPEVEEYVTGGFLKGQNHAAITILPYLESEGIEKIDFLVASHKHGDHIGGMPYIIRNFDVGAVYDNGTVYAGRLAEEYLNAVKENPEIDYITARPGMEIPFADGIICQVLGPLREYSGTESDENNMSVALRVTAGGVSFLLPGDMEITAELDMLSYGESLRTTVVKAPHHGSTSSSSRPLLDILMPEAAVFSCGRYNPYGFPPFEIIRRYEDRGAKIYRTDYDGNIEFITDGVNFRTATSR